MRKLTKKEYTASLLLLCKLFCNDDITVDEYRDSLHTLLDSYRKDYHLYGY